jgi:hypothetical protein
VGTLSTQTVTFLAQTTNLSTARESVDNIARILDLHVERVEERPRRLSREIKVTVTGAPKNVAEFRTQMAALTYRPPGVHTPLDPILNDVIDVLRRRRRRRSTGQE